jgi:hypothetical protein
MASNKITAPRKATALKPIQPIKPIVKPAKKVPDPRTRGADMAIRMLCGGGKGRRRKGR